MNSIWNRVTNWFVQNVPPRQFAPNPGASIELLAETESDLGASLPDDVRESYLIHDGGADAAFYEAYELLPLSRVLDAWRTREGAGLELIEGFPEGPIKPQFWNPKWIPIMDNSGNNISVDLDPAAGGTVGQLIEYSHEEGPIWVLAPGFGKWLAQYANDLEGGKYRFEPLSHCITTGRSLHDLYYEHVCQTPFWVQHSDDLSNTPKYYFIKSVNGQTSGPLSTENLNPQIVVDVYENERLVRKDHKISSDSSGANFYRSKPDWARLDPSDWPTSSRGPRWIATP